MEEKKQRERQKAWSKIVARAWTDEAFKMRLFKNPEAVLKEHGMEVPKGMKYIVHENTGSESHLLLPRAPEGLSEADLKELAAGKEYQCGSIVGN